VVSKKAIIIGIIIALLSAIGLAQNTGTFLNPSTATGLGDNTKSTRSSSYTPVVGDWYEVAWWEVEFCRKWGGSVNGGINRGSSSKTPLSISLLTMTAQGEKIEYGIAGQATLYKVSWYIEPVSNELEFKVWLTGEDTLQIGSGTAKNAKAGFGYYTEYLDKNFTHVKLEYPGNYLQVPIVTKQGCLNPIGL